MDKRFIIELVSKIRKPDTGDGFINGLLKVLSIILYPILILVGLLFMLFALLLSLFQRIISKKEKRQAKKQADIKDESTDHQWTILTETNSCKLFKQYIGEVRFGPVYLKLKSEPCILAIEDKYFGDWFFGYQNGIFLQEWNSTTKPDTNLIFADTETLETKVIAKNIPSVLWKNVVTEDKKLELICDAGAEMLTYKINATDQ